MELTAVVRSADGRSQGSPIADLSVLTVIEFDSLAADSFDLKFPNESMWRGDVRPVPARDVNDQTQPPRGEFSMLSVFPPCQGFLDECGA